MPQFLNEFFPQVAAKQKAAAPQKSAYCTFDDAGLQAWTSSMFIAGAITGETSALVCTLQQPRSASAHVQACTRTAASCMPLSSFCMLATLVHQLKGTAHAPLGLPLPRLKKVRRPFIASKTAALVRIPHQQLQGCQSYDRS